MGFQRDEHRNTKSGLAVLFAALVAVACGVSAEDSSEVGKLGQYLNPPEGWRVWTVTPTSTQTFADGPTVCLATGEGVLIAGRDLTTNRYRTFVNQWRLNGSPAWADFGSSAFVSKPACSALDEVVEPAPALNNQFILMGRASDNKFYARTGLVDTTVGDWPNDPPTQPTVKIHTHKLSDDQYASAPAVTVSNGKVIVVGRRSDNRFYALQNTLASSTTAPYSPNGWGAAEPSDPLPSPWLPEGDPTIGNTKPFIGVVTVATRARHPLTGVMRIYYGYWDGSAFIEVSPGVKWAFVPTGGVVIASDPTLEVDLHVDLATLHFRSTDNRIYQSSGIANLWGTFTAVRTNEGDTFTGSPAAVGNGNFEGQHMVVAKKSNNRFYWSTPVPF